MATQKSKSGSAMIAQERAEQILIHGYTIDSDQAYYSRDVFQNAAIAILHMNRKEWPDSSIPIAIFEAVIKKSKQEQVSIAGAFLAAEIDYINLQELKIKYRCVSASEIAEHAIVEMDQFIETVSEEIIATALATPDKDAIKVFTDAFSINRLQELFNEFNSVANTSELSFAHWLAAKGNIEIPQCAD